MANSKLMVDGHVHVYDCYEPDKFFHSAVANMSHWAEKSLPGQENVHKLLLLTEGKGNDFFSKFKHNSIRFKKPAYRFTATQEQCSLILAEGKTPLCWVVRGRQIVTRENLEVLALATDQVIADGLPIQEVLDRLITQKDIAALAWGVGKWFFKRGKIIEKILADHRTPYLFMGDNSARPVFWSRPALFKLAERAGVPVINGSDPLPFSQEENKVGSCGFILTGDFDPARPAESLRRILSARERSIQLFGQRDGVFSFVKRQFKMFHKKYSPFSGD